jgi:hypothetical protein
LSVEERSRLPRDYADHAMAALRRAVRQGYKDTKSLREDPALAPLRSRGDFKELLAGMR